MSDDIDDEAARPVRAGLFANAATPFGARLARALRHRETAAERRLWLKLRNRKLDGLSFRRHVPIAGFVADFLCRDARLVVAIERKREAADLARARALEASGYEVLRVLDRDVLVATDTVLDTIRKRARRSEGEVT